MIAYLTVPGLVDNLSELQRRDIVPVGRGLNTETRCKFRVWASTSHCFRLLNNVQSRPQFSGVCKSLRAAGSQLGVDSSACAPLEEHVS